MKIVVIDYGAGNIKSIQFALERLGCNSILSKSPEDLKNADKIIFPGVGEASNAMQKLRTSGLDLIIPTLQQPVLGICLGMQLLCNYTEENKTKGLGVFNVKVKRFENTVKVPQIGWNSIQEFSSPLFSKINKRSYMYFVHSYYAEICSDTVATSYYDIDYSAALQNKNFYAVQFHPEKSGDVGAQILKNFIEL